MASSTSNGAVAQPRRSFKQVLRSYFYWTYSRGSFHYDVMVTLILLFIFVTPHLWDYGAKPSLATGPLHPFQVVSNGRGVIITVQASDVNVPRRRFIPASEERPFVKPSSLLPEMMSSSSAGRPSPTPRAISHGRFGHIGRHFFASVTPSRHQMLKR